MKGLLFPSSLLSIAHRPLFSPYWIDCERSELNGTKLTATELFKGRRQKKCSTICPSNARELSRCW